MANVFDIVFEEFQQELTALKSLVNTSATPGMNSRVRIAGANAATLLLAATFEEFIREMAREFARSIVRSVHSFDQLPNKLAATAWKRTMDGLARVRFEGHQVGGQESVFAAAQAKFTVIHEFCKGDLTQDIYRDLIHNENNMRPTELNGLFGLSGLKDVCKKVSDKAPVQAVFGESDQGKAHGKLLAGFEDFFERRNLIAHALNPGQSNGPDQILNDITMLEGFGAALSETLSSLAPNEPA